MNNYYRRRPGRPKKGSPVDPVPMTGAIPPQFKSPKLTEEEKKANKKYRHWKWRQRRKLMGMVNYTLWMPRHKVAEVKAYCKDLTDKWMREREGRLDAMEKELGEPLPDDRDIPMPDVDDKENGLK